MRIAGNTVKSGNATSFQPNYCVELISGMYSSYFNGNGTFMATRSNPELSSRSHGWEKHYYYIDNLLFITK